MIAILGGGKNLRADHNRLPWYYWRVGVNHHWVKLGIDPVEIVFLDDRAALSNDHPLYHALRGDTPTVSIRYNQADNQVLDYKQNKITDAGQLAVAWCLEKYDGDIKLCGFDLRDRNPEVVRRWGEFLGNLKPEQIERLSPMSGPLAEMI